MPLEIRTQGSCVNEKGRWSYTITYQSAKTQGDIAHSESGEEIGTTDIQMKLMAILKALTYLRSIDSIEPIIVRSDCSLCIKCITKEFDCASDDAYKRDKITRGFVQYLQEIWWKMSGMDVRFEIMSSSSA
jgi:ribonuclease HI